MPALLAIINTEKPIGINEATGEIAPSDVVSLDVITGINPVYYSTPELFLAHWNAGIDARQKWEVFSDNFFKLFTESGLIDAQGTHFDEYDLGSICRFIVKNKETIMPQSFRESTFSTIIISALKTGAKTMRKGKDIEVDWPQMAEYVRPMAETILMQIALSPTRRELVMPILLKFFEEQIRAAEQLPSSTDDH